MIVTYGQLVADSAAAAAEQIAPALKRSDALSEQVFEAHLRLIQELADQVQQLRRELRTLAGQLAEQRGEDIAADLDMRRRVRALEDIAVSQDRRLGGLGKTMEDMDAGIGALRGAMTEAESAIADLEVAVFEGDEEEQAEAEPAAEPRAHVDADDIALGLGCTCVCCEARRAEKPADPSASCPICEARRAGAAKRAMSWIGGFGTPRPACQCARCRAARGETKG